MTDNDIPGDARSITGEIKLGMERISMADAGQALGIDYRDSKLHKTGRGGLQPHVTLSYYSLPYVAYYMAGCRITHPPHVM